MMLGFVDLLMTFSDLFKGIEGDLNIWFDLLVFFGAISFCLTKTA